MKQIKAGKFLIISNYDIGNKEMYELHKSRDSIEKLFDAYKTTLEADKLYLHDDESVYGHVFIASPCGVSLIICLLQNTESS